MKLRQIGMVWAVASALLLVQSAAVACPNCKVSIENQTESQVAGGSQGNVAAGYYYSILFMMSMPFILATCLVVAIRRETRRSPDQNSPQSY